MTDIDKIIGYYSQFDEWGRLDSFPGRLELEIMLELIGQHLPPGSEIFDLGGGAGRYSYELGLKGYQMHLADLSPDLTQTAREKLSNFAASQQIKSIEVANALDLSENGDETFDHVLLFGPLYHLTKEEEVLQCLSEVYRVLKPNGKIIAAYIPYHCGVISILERSFASPHQVDGEILKRVADEGVFHNGSNSGFQEGHYLKTKDLLAYMQQTGFQQLALRSIRGIGYKQEEKILKLKQERPDYYSEVMKVLHQTAAQEPILETCGHAVYVGEKK